MGAVAKAARAGGAQTIGVIPDALVKIEFADHDSDQLHVVKDMRERKGLIEELSDAFVVLPGGAGTLEELFEEGVVIAAKRLPGRPRLNPETLIATA